MKTVNFDTYSELIDDVLRLIEEKDSISIFADYNLAYAILQNIDLEYDVIFSNILRLKYSKNIINAFVGKNCKNIYYIIINYF